MSPREEARSAGQILYVGKKCPHGHDGERYVSSGNCRECTLSHTKEQSTSGYYKNRYKQDRAKFLRLSHIRYEANKESAIRAASKWARENPDKRRAVSASYKHRRRSWELSGMTGGELLEWAKTQKKTCYWCGKRCVDKYHIDHYTPLSAGGEHRPHNLVIACPGCNLRKNARDPYMFAIQCGRLF